MLMEDIHTYTHFAATPQITQNRTPKRTNERESSGLIIYKYWFYLKLNVILFVLFFLFTFRLIYLHFCSFYFFCSIFIYFTRSRVFYSYFLSCRTFLPHCTRYLKRVFFFGWYLCSSVATHIIKYGLFQYLFQLKNA